MQSVLVSLPLQEINITVFSVNGHLVNVFIIMKPIIDIFINYSFNSNFWKAFSYL